MKRMLGFGVVLGLVVVQAATAQAESKAWSAGKKFIPAGMEVVGGVNATGVHDSDLYKQLMPLALAKMGDAATQIDGLKAECGIDIVNAIDSLVFALDATEKNGTVVIAFKGTNRAALEQCATKHARSKAQALTITQNGQLTQYGGVGDKSVFMRWIAPDVVAIATDPTDKATAMAATAGGVTGDKALKGLGAVNTGASVWLVVNKQADLPGMGAKMTNAYGSANLAAGVIAVDTHVGVDSPAAAQSAATQAASQLGALKSASGGTGQMATIAGLLATVKVSAVASEILVTAQVPEKAIFDLIALLVRGGP